VGINFGTLESAYFGCGIPGPLTGGGHTSLLLNHGLINQLEYDLGGRTSKWGKKKSNIAKLLYARTRGPIWLDDLLQEIFDETISMDLEEVVESANLLRDLLDREIEAKESI